VSSPGRPSSFFAVAGQVLFWNTCGVQRSGAELVSDSEEFTGSSRRFDYGREYRIYLPKSDFVVLGVDQSCAIDL
jgi:hypothetical protein